MDLANEKPTTSRKGPGLQGNSRRKRVLQVLYSNTKVEEAIDDKTSSTRLQKFAHSLGFETIYLLFQEIRGSSAIEAKKIVILEDIRSACYGSLLHLLPTAASVTLCVLIWKGYYIGSELSGISGQDGLKLLGLQLSAKMLELLAMASLSTILFALLRTLLISDTLPFGAITSGFQFNNLSFLWSKEFVATCAAEFRGKTLLITTIVVFTFFATTLGSSAAVASQPVLRNWPAGGTSFWLNTTSKELWPSSLDEITAADLPCISSPNTSCSPSNYNLLKSEILSFWPTSSASYLDSGTLPKVMPEQAHIAGRQLLHTLSCRFRGPLEYFPFLTAATTPSAAISDALSQVEKYWFLANSHLCSLRRASFCWYNHIFYSIDTVQPLTYVRCSASDTNATVKFPRLDQGINNYPLVNYTNSTIGSQQWFETVTGNGSRPNVTWVQLPQPDFGKASLGAVVALPRNPNQVLACTIDARWAQATASISFLGGPATVSGVPDNWLGGGQYQLNSSGLLWWPQVTISPGWAQTMNPMLSNSSNSVFTALYNSVGRLGNISNAPFSLNAVGAVLALMITDSLARTGSSAIISGSLKGLQEGQWMKEILPKGVFGTGGSAFTYNPLEGDQSTKFEAQVTVNGYGYGTTTATVLSTIVLFVYSLIAVIYVGYSILLGRTTSSSWESITDVVALALNSTPSSVLKNTGAGISTLGTLKQPVKIGVKDDHLQMIIGDKNGLESIVRNELYG